MSGWLLGGGGRHQIAARGVVRAFRRGRAHLRATARRRPTAATKAAATASVATASVAIDVDARRGFFFGPRTTATLVPAWRWHPAPDCARARRGRMVGDGAGADLLWGQYRGDLGRPRRPGAWQLPKPRATSITRSGRATRRIPLCATCAIAARGRATCAGGRGELRRRERVLCLTPGGANPRTCTGYRRYSGRDWKLMVGCKASHVVRSVQPQRRDRHGGQRASLRAAPCLFNITADPTEHDDVAGSYPQFVQSLCTFYALNDEYHGWNSPSLAATRWLCAAAYRSNGLVTWRDAQVID